VNTIWKYPIDLRAVGRQRLPIPQGVHPRSVIHAGIDPQQGRSMLHTDLAVWVMVATEIEDLGYVVEVEVFGTGHEIGTEWLPSDHVATIHDGQFIWHVFAEVTQP
jgi:hypothetical protein